MYLRLASGTGIRDATERDVLAHIKGEDFAILGPDSATYIQCAAEPGNPDEFILEYQEDSLEEHYRAADGPIALDRVIAAFVKYVRGDMSWKSDFNWQKL